MDYQVFLDSLLLTTKSDKKDLIICIGYIVTLYFEYKVERVI